MGRLAPLWAWQRCRPRPAHPLVGAAAGSLGPGCSVGGVVFVPSPPPSVLTRFTLNHGSHSRGFIPLGTTLPLWGCQCPVATRLPRLLPGGTPHGFSATPEALWPPLLFPHSGGFVGHSGGLAAPVVAPHSQGFTGLVFPSASRPPSLRRPLPMAAPCSRLVSGRGGGFPGIAPAENLHPQDALPFRCPASPMTLPSALLFPIPPPPTVVASSSVVNPSDSAPLHSALLSALSYGPPPLRSTPPLLRCCLSDYVAFPGPILRGPVPLSSSSSQPSSLSLPPTYLLSPLFCSHSFSLIRIPSPPPPLGLLRPLAPPRAPLPLAPAADIVRRDKYVGDSTGEVVARCI